MLLSSDTEPQLLKLLSEGSHSAFEKIYKRYWSPLFGYAHNRLGTELNAEEVIQEVFLKLWHNRHSAQQIESLQAYLFTAVKYALLNVIKEEKVRMKYSHHFRNFISESSTNNTLEVIAEQDLERALQFHISKLPAQRQKIFILSRIKNESIPEIAASLNLSRKTVENQISKALKSLRMDLSDFFIVFFASLFLLS